MSARGSAKSISAVVNQGNQTVGDRVSVPPQTQTQSEPLSFETPPGVGSAKGGN